MKKEKKKRGESPMLKRPCKECEKMFEPSSRGSRCCDICLVKIEKIRSKKTYRYTLPIRINVQRWKELVR